MYEFNVHKPGSVTDAVSALKGADDGTFMAGGQTLIPTLKQRLASPSDVVDLGGIGELSDLPGESDPAHEVRIWEKAPDFRAGAGPGAKSATQSLADLDSVDRAFVAGAHEDGERPVTLVKGG